MAEDLETGNMNYLKNIINELNFTKMAVSEQSYFMSFLTYEDIGR